MGTRQVPFGRTIYIEREDFMETPVKKFFRMTPGKEVRLKGAYIVHCDELIKDERVNSKKFIARLILIHAVEHPVQIVK